MAYRLVVPSLPAISPEEYLSDFLKNGDVNDEACVIEYGRRLGAVVSNKRALIDRINSELAGWHDGFLTIYSQGSMLLAGERGDNVYLRVNFWPTIPKSAPDKEKLALVYLYEIPHDHAYSFVTTNYFGPGYVTDLYDYDSGRLDGVVGEHVALTPAGTVMLTDGVGLYFRGGRDAHVQHQPSALTVSLNLMTYRNGDRSRDQFYFDLEGQRVSGFHTGTLCARRRELVKLASIVGDDNTTQLLLELAAAYPCRTTRRAAMQGLLVSRRASPDEFCRPLVDDSDVMVRRMARHAIE